MRTPSFLAVFVVLLAPAFCLAESPKRLEVVIPPQADKLERFAASELQRYLVQLFGASVHLVPAATDSADCVFLLGAAGRIPRRRLARGNSHRLRSKGFSCGQPARRTSRR